MHDFLKDIHDYGDAVLGICVFIIAIFSITMIGTVQIILAIKKEEVPESEIDDEETEEPAEEVTPCPHCGHDFIG